MASLRSSQQALRCLTQRGARTTTTTSAAICAPITTILPRRAPRTALSHHPSQRFYSDDAAPPAPPLLQKLKADLKAAMRAKDAPRLSVIRTALGAATSASKTGSGLATDAQVVAVLRRARAASAEAAAEFAAADRRDLVEGEEARIAVFDEYVAGSGVETLSEAQLRDVVAAVVQAGETKMGEVMKKLLAPGGPLEGKSVERAELAKVVKDVLG
ncbi:hypothetical protein SLS62_003876 [Diatrype stigma]|uniref:Altered inheritance of mitochondria protein 41 n=1 Tax=Diatrype stigma TaxID=117547 RepID=A0AAN9UU66_9PEZI